MTHTKDQILKNLVTFYEGQPMEIIYKVAMKHIKTLDSYDLIKLGYLIGERSRPVSRLHLN